MEADISTMGTLPADPKDGQKKILQNKEDRLACLLHPIRQCPDDILVIIFELAVHSDPPELFKAATAISHVCRRWRAVVLRSSRLWSQIDILVEDKAFELGLFLKRTLPRVRDTPVDIKISRRASNLDMNSITRLIDCLELNPFKAIKSLDIVLPTLSEIKKIFTPAFTYSHGPLEILSISRIRDETASEWDCSCVFRQFPTVDSIHFENFDQLVIGGHNVFPSIAELRLKKVRIPGLAPGLHRVPSLQFLAVEDTTIHMDAVAVDISLESLLGLQVNSFDSFPWRRLTAPRLQEITLCDTGQDAVQFLCRHTTLRQLKLGVWVSKEILRFLSPSLVGLTTLIIGGEIDFLFPDHGANSPFPNLKELRVFLIRALNISLQRFEDMVQARCLPQELQNQTQSLARLEIFEIAGIVEVLTQEPWSSSRLLVHFQREFPIPESCSTIAYTFTTSREPTVSTLS